MICALTIEAWVVAGVMRSYGEYLAAKEMERHGASLDESSQSLHYELRRVGEGVVREAAETGNAVVRWRTGLAITVARKRPVAQSLRPTRSPQ